MIEEESTLSVMRQDALIVGKRQPSAFRNERNPNVVGRAGTQPGLPVPDNSEPRLQERRDKRNTVQVLVYVKDRTRVVLYAAARPRHARSMSADTAS